LAASPAVVVGDSVLDFRCCTLFLSAVRWPRLLYSRFGF
jgi:hypothetical protein